MRTLFAIIVLLCSGWAFGNAFTPPVADVCSGAPPALGAGTSPDGPVCLGQSVRDSHNTVWTFTAPSCPGFSSGHCIVGSVGRYPAPKVQIKGGVVQVQNQYSPQWTYYEYSIGGWLYVGSPIPAPAGPAPKGGQ